ncbi:Undecaprenyl pyrophosphate synthetase [Magnetococcus marinus MC-1]|uniref:Isoprenyl transferase n=1 Tax=Magnetococcus marinus (strain ATCC BAA-1437 / JCM 17883 / MC-1) TaxID=156889 RepID=A0L8Q9_MAGMM|nr:isoprenyl transferase [Magnetococcus marinus]ABK44352.1 Undecaprenyl pyrophosphate synthetase [Magnetococcus marinus MC-1]
MSKSAPITLPEKLPRHVAIVMDGNRRWARKRYLPRLEGHRQGVKSVRRSIEASLDFGIETLTLYTFSAENWKRPKDEVSALMNLLALHLKREMDDLHERGVRFRALGRLDELPTNVREYVQQLEEKTAGNTRLNFNIALNYGGRQEIVDAAKAMSKQVLEGHLKWDDIGPEHLACHLTTHDQPDPDLMIRTGGDHRISNFLLWQMAYTELIFLPIYWPEFNRDHFLQALHEYAERERRFGAAG